MLLNNRVSVTIRSFELGPRRYAATFTGPARVTVPRIRTSCPSSATRSWDTDCLANSRPGLERRSWSVSLPRQMPD